METEFRPNYVVYPGVLLKEEIKGLKLTQKKVAEEAGISKTVINEVIKGKRSINAELAVRLEKVLESSASFWLKAQALYDEILARIKLSEEGSVELSLKDNEAGYVELSSKNYKDILNQRKKYVVYNLNSVEYRDIMEAA